ncbi:Laminin G domain protein [Posidoniimonas polymericola]|uniref:Laminin G domain protein n=1 Tax=Posidoniimonas polymericola TaxID=2528002 RepID=A0A5C5YLT0_9BACT|nr:LamG-like jellyroll fold domain-containing protein [Posidoniimonas polymericola]TWT75708.1 Laminin G domain protein [Posidoniimonas polymericola]
MFRGERLANRRAAGRSGWFEPLEPRVLLAGDPVAEWRFDSTAGTVLVDSAGTADGVVTGSSVYNPTASGLVNVMPVWTASNPTQWGGGTQNGALRLFSDTDGAIVDASDAPPFTSVSFWFKADTTNPTRYNSTNANGGSTSGTPVAMPLFESGSSTSGVSIYLYNDRLYVGAWNSSIPGWSSGSWLYTAQHAVVAGRWHHVVLSIDPSSSPQAGGMVGYLDAAAFGAASGATVAGNASLAFGRADGSTRFLLGTGGSSVPGNSSPSSGNHRGFAGYLDEARLYDEPLSAAEVLEIYEATGPAEAEEAWLIRDSGRAAVIGRFRFSGQLASEHFVFKWGPDLPSAMQPVTTYIQQNLNRLEMAWDIIVDQAGMAAPSARDGVNYKINAYILDTGLWWVDANGGTFSGAYAGPDPTGFSALYVSPWALAQHQSPRSIYVEPWGQVANTTTTPHEFTHVLQSESGGFGASDYSGPFYEAHANFGASLVDAYDTGNYRAEITARSSINGRYGERRHRYSMATDFRYQAHPFLNYLTELTGFGDSFVTSGLWSDPDAQGAGKDPWQVLRNNFASDEEFARIYAEYVASSVTYKTLYGGALLSGLPAIPTHDTEQRLFRTYLEPVASSPGWFQVPEQDAPEQYGSNIIRLSPVDRVAGQAHVVEVDLDGYVLPGQSSGVYATLVAIRGTGSSVEERYSNSWQGGKMVFTLQPDETDLYLAVTAIPSVHKNYIWSHPFHPAGNIGYGLDRFPYRVSFDGVAPARSEDAGERPAPSGNAVRHINPDGSVGGWKTVAVASTVYLGPNVWVTGGLLRENARIEDYATITGGLIAGDALVYGHATVTSGSVRENASIGDYATISGGAVSGDAQVTGDALVLGGQIRGQALVTDYATILGGNTVVAGQTVVKGYGVVDNADMQGNALVMSSGLAAGTGLVTDRGVQFNGEPSAQEAPLVNTQYNNLFARYTFDTQDDNVVWDAFNTTYGWMSSTPASWSAPSGVSGLSGVLGFGGDDQYVELSTELVSLNDQTIQLWARWDGSGDVDQKLFEFARNAGNYLYLQPTSAQGGVKLEIAVDGVVRTLYAVEPLTPGEWQHVAVTFEDDKATLWVNGAAVAAKTSVTMDPHQVRATSALLGRGLAAGSGFRGEVDNVLVYSDARTGAELLTDVRQVLGGSYTPGVAAEIDHDPGDYNRDGRVDAADYSQWRDQGGAVVDHRGAGADGDYSGVVDAGDYAVWRSHFGVTTPEGQGVMPETDNELLVAHYKFDGDASDSVQQNDAATSGGPGYTSGVDGLAIDLDGVNDVVTLPSDIADHDDITVATWVYWDGGGVWQRIFDFGNGTNEYMFLTPAAGGGTSMRFAITVGSNGAEQVLEAPAIAPGVWTHVAVTLEGDLGMLYVNGAVADADTVTLNPSSFAPAFNYIGESQWPDPLFNGRIDDFRIYNYALSGGEVGALAAAAPAAAQTADGQQNSLLALLAGPTIDLAYEVVDAAFESPVPPVDPPGGEYLASLTIEIQRRRQLLILAGRPASQHDAYFEESLEPDEGSTLENPVLGSVFQR